MRQHKHLISAPHGHNFYLSVLYTKGSGTHEIDFNVYNVNPGIVHVISPGQVHNWKLSNDIEGYIIFHTGPFYNFNFTSEKLEYFPFFSSAHNRPVITVPHSVRTKIESLFKELNDDYYSDKLMKFQKICSLLNVLYIELSLVYLPATVKAKRKHGQWSKFKKLEDLINVNYKKVKSAGDYAKIMNMSEKNLNRISKASINKTTTELISDRIVLEAKRMLIYSNASVSQIADELGYYENSYFFKIFKKRTGQTPLEFQKKFRRN